MEKKTEYKVNDNGSFSKRETITTTPEDGFVPERELRPSAMPSETRGKARMGYSTTVSYTTTDPKVTRPILWGFCILFLLIAIVTLIRGLWMFSIAFGFCAVFLFVKGNKDIDKIAKKLKAEGKDVTIDSKEELADVISEVSNDFKSGFKQVGQETFTAEHVNNFIKLTIPIYAILAVVVSVFCSVVISKKMGIFIFLLFAVIAVVYYFVFLKLLVKLFKKK